MKHTFIFMLFLFTCSLCSCSSYTLMSQGENSLIRYKQFDLKTGQSTLELVLVQETHKDYQNLYSEKRKMANIKKVPLSKFTLLVESLEDMGFVEMAKNWPPGMDPKQEGASKAILFENEGGRWVCMNMKDLSIDERENFKLMDETVRNCYDSVLSLQVVTNKEGENIFYEEQRRLEEENKKRINP